MDPRFLDRYGDELRYIHALTHEYGRDHPKIARRLGISDTEIADPFVQRLLQSFAFVMARGVLQLEDAFPAFIQPLLAVTYPNYITPTPSMTLARAYPREDDGHSSDGILLPRGTAFSSFVSDEEQTACEFRSSQDVRIFPLDIARVRAINAPPPDIPMLYRYVPDNRPVLGALRLTLRTMGGVPISSLSGLDRLPVYLSGDEGAASRLFELLHTASISTVIAAPGAFANGRLHCVTRDAVVHEGLEPEHSLLPRVPHKFHGHNLLQEWFAFPARFGFFTLTGLARPFSSIHGPEAEIVVLLSRPFGAMAEQTSMADFALYCTPLINLFPRTTARLSIDPAHAEHLITPVPERPRDYEMHSVQAVRGQVNKGSPPVAFHDHHAAYRDDRSRDARCFALRRVLKQSDDDERQYETRRPFTETRTLLTLTDQGGQPLNEGTKFVTLDAWLTNRDLPCVMSRNGRNDVDPGRALPIAGIGLIRAPTAPRPAMAVGMRAWQLYGQLNLGFDTLNASTPGEGLRRLLRLYLDDDASPCRPIDAIVDTATRPVVCLLSPELDQPYGRAIECTLTVDEQGLGDTSPYALGLVVERYLARHVSSHCYTTTVLESTQRGRITQWPPRMGTRGVA
ncbi:type VI secretion system baseplate subunit TssF [Caballeronia sp. LZ019]|uniref:type VI secretion system baseplate subunit TssF n=1 Tax=Caballeronia sp. LZ019 TaxID=3038555 RepID=UPI0028563E27|nr:type VI secretion system baseplate subunit TssF [Caballeronia sp. LZ019]MDR5808466.1 type VI secretion system baseplate subunit TssF [Caballeronia sp. LZ019]